MDSFNIGKFIFGLRAPEWLIKKPPVNNSQQGIFGNALNSDVNAGLANTRPQPNPIINNLSPIHQMNALAHADRSVYIKNLLGLPQTVGEILQNAQIPNRPLMGGTLGVNNINQELLVNKNALSEIFEEMQNSELQNVLNAQVLPSESQSAQSKPDAVALMFSGMISLPDVSKLILQNSKQAVAALVIAMANASKHGLDGKQIQDTLSVINSCISMAESDNPAQNLKSLMMLYLPWLPLNEEIGFDLEIDTPEGENDSNDSKLTVLIQTKNYGNLKGVFTLTTSNSVDIYIVCTDKFPKKILQKHLMTESSSHAMNTTVDIEDVKPTKDDINETRETKVNLSATNEMNPYLLLMAHAFIRYTIMLDNDYSIT